MTDIDLSTANSYSRLKEALLDKNTDDEMWQRIFARLYKEEGQSTHKFKNIFAEDINDFKSTRASWQINAKVGVSSVMLIALVLPQVTLASSVIIGSASLTLCLLDIIYTFCPFTNFDPVLTIDADSSVTVNKEHRTFWSEKMELNQLSEDKEQRLAIVKTLAVSTVLLFAAGIALTTQAASVYLIGSIVAYAASVLLRVNDSQEDVQTETLHMART